MGDLLRLRAVSLLVVALALTACNQREAARLSEPAVTPPASVRQTILLPGGAQAHIVTMPTSSIESSRCVIVEGVAGHVAVHCASSAFGLGDDE